MGHAAPNQAVEPTPYSLRLAPAFGRGSPRAFGHFLDDPYCQRHQGGS